MEEENFKERLKAKDDLIKMYYEENKQLKQKLSNKEAIIKEAREYFQEFIDTSFNCHKYRFLNKSQIALLKTVKEDILAILDKEVSNE